MSTSNPPNQIGEPLAAIPVYIVEGGAAVSGGNPLSVSSGGSGAGGLSDTILTDDSGTYFLARDTGAAITYVTLAGAPYTPSTNIKPQSVALGATSTLQTAGNASLTTIAAGVKLQDGLGNVINSLSAGTGENGLLISTGLTLFIYSTVNSSTTQLAASATFPGVIESALSEPAISINLQADQQITLQILQYEDLAGTKLVATWTYVVAAGAGLNISRYLNGNYVKVTATNNGGSTTTTFVLSVAYGEIGAATQLGNEPVSLNEINGTALNIGQQTLANSIPVSVATGGTVNVAGQGKIATVGTAVNLPSNALVNGFNIIANPANVGTLTVGTSAVTNIIDGTGNGYRLIAGQSTPGLGVSNTNVYWVNGTVAGDTFDFIGG